jgi:hypothetical protein
MRFLERRDDDFDVVKLFLIISMVIAHSFQIYYNQLYNKHLTYYVLVGFVFTAGLTIGSVYQELVLKKPGKYGGIIFLRSLKLLGIFIFANAMILSLYPGRILQGRKLQPFELLVSALLRDGDMHFSFSVLIAISLTFLFSIVLLCWRIRSIDLIFIGMMITGLWAIEVTGKFDYYTIKMIAVGVFGVILSKNLFYVNWDNFKSKYSKWYLVLWMCYATYQLTLIILDTDKEWKLNVGHYINITILLLLAVYFTSFRMGISNLKLITILNKLLAKNMLFAYLFHLLLLRYFAKIMGSGNFYFAIAVSLITLLVTILTCQLLNYLTDKYMTINKIYSIVFR